MNKKPHIKIIALLSVAIVILAIWLFKNFDSASDSTNSFSVLDENFRLQTTSLDLDVLKSYGLPMILGFGSESCEPCRRMAPTLVKLNREMQGKAIIKYLDVWKYSKEAEGFPLQVIPTQIFINSDGSPYVPSEDLGIRFLYYSHNETNELVYTVHEGLLTEEQMRRILYDMGATS